MHLSYLPQESLVKSPFVVTLMAEGLPRHYSEKVQELALFVIDKEVGTLQTVVLGQSDREIFPLGINKTAYVLPFLSLFLSLFLLLLFLECSLEFPNIIVLLICILAKCQVRKGIL